MTGVHYRVVVYLQEPFKTTLIGYYSFQKMSSSRRIRNEFIIFQVLRIKEDFNVSSV
jgi:hypothetical protein